MQIKANCYKLKQILLYLYFTYCDLLCLCQTNNMATFKILLKKDKQKANGEFPLYLRITEKGKPKYISFGISLEESQWDHNKEKVRSHPNKTRLNAIITKKKSEAQRISIDQEIKGKEVTSASIKSKLTGKQSTSFSDYFKQYLEDLRIREKIGTLDKASAVYRKFDKYNKGANINFNQITIPYLEKYEKHLRVNLKNGTNTIHSNLKIFRMLFNKAAQYGLIELEQNPFLRYKLSTEKTEKTYLTKEELSRVVSLELDKGSKVDVHRDMFVFACYTGGIRISDILQLRWNEIEDNHVRIKMQKGKDQLSIKITNVSMAILEKYKSDTGTSPSNFVFPCLSNDKIYNPTILFKDISAKGAYANKNLKTIAKLANIGKRVSFHTSRHTYATLALSLGLQMSQVSKLMGHKDMKVTQHYAKLINKDLDDAMEAFNNLL